MSPRRAALTLLLGGLATAGLVLGGCPGGGGGGCDEDADCPAGRYCVASECTFDCPFDADCRAGFRCTARGRCEPYCESDAECAAGMHCLEGDCVSECSGDGDCAADEFCTERGRCEPVCTPTNGGVEACDRVDNDCDGTTDEEWPELGSPCANGACPEGQWVCTAAGDGVE